MDIGLLNLPHAPTELRPFMGSVPSLLFQIFFAMAGFFKTPPLLNPSYQCERNGSPSRDRQTPVTAEGEFVSNRSFKKPLFLPSLLAPNAGSDPPPDATFFHRD